MSTKAAPLIWEIKPLALLTVALWYFFDEDGLFALLLPAVLIHELGHVLFLRIGGLRLRRISLGLFGLEMDYWGELKGIMGLASIVAGPLFGIIYGIACRELKSEYLNLSGSLSILLSVFNLLPVLPLDGGRLLCMAAGEKGTVISRAISVILAAAALFFLLWKGWFSLFAMAVWLLWCNMKRPE